MFLLANMFLIVIMCVKRMFILVADVVYMLNYRPKKTTTRLQVQELFDKVSWTRFYWVFAPVGNNLEF